MPCTFDWCSRHLQLEVIVILDHGKGIFANFLWGMVPAYYFLVGTVGAERMTAYRFIFTFLLLLVVGRVQRRQFSIAYLRHSFVPGSLLALNAYVYLFAVLNGHVLEAAYGYLLTPVLTIVCARLLLGVTYSAVQWAGAAICLGSVTFYALMIGTLPWFGIGIALPFALYLTWHRHRSTASSLEALRHESAIMLIFPILYLANAWEESQSAILAELISPQGLVIAASGLMTVAPLALFVSVCARLPAIHVGLYQFIAPIISALIAATLFGEELTSVKIGVGLGLMLGVAIAALPLSAKDNRHPVGRP